jgi:hypothetical protein
MAEKRVVTDGTLGPAEERGVDGEKGEGEEVLRGQAP